MIFSFTAVRSGNLAKFNEALENFSPKFKADHTYTLIIRLRHNVIKTGVRMINLSYSRISLKDVAQKLLLDSPEDAEFIVAKVRHQSPQHLELNPFVPWDLLDKCCQHLWDLFLINCKENISRKLVG